MKTIMTFVMLIQVSLSFAGGREAGNGGGAWACFNEKKEIQWIEPVDLFEAKEEYKLNIQNFNEMSVEEILEQYKTRIKKFDKELYVELIPLFENLSKNTLFVEQDLEILNDTIFRVRLHHETYKGGEIRYIQLANYTNYDKILINNYYYSNPHFTDIDKAILLLHEVIYTYRRHTYGDTTSDNTRKIVAFIISNLPEAHLVEELESTFANVNICNRQSYIVETLMKKGTTHDCRKVNIKDLNKIKKLSINGITRKIEIHKGDFAGLSNLEDLMFGGVKIMSTESGAFSDLRRLTTFKFMSAHFAKITNGTFWGLNKLTSLVFTHYYYDRDAEGFEIRKDAFEGLTSLKSLTLGGTYLSRIEDDGFNGLSKLESLLIGGCYYYNNPSLHKDLFNGLENLKNLSIVSCNIERVEANAFSHLKNLTNFKLSYKKISTIGESAFDAPNLKSLNLKANHLYSIRENYFKNLVNLEELDLSDNKIGIIDSFSFNDLTSLKTLNLSKNKIKSLTENSFKGLQTLEKLYLIEAFYDNTPMNAGHFSSLPATTDIFITTK